MKKILAATMFAVLSLTSAHAQEKPASSPFSCLAEKSATYAFEGVLDTLLIGNGPDNRFFTLTGEKYRFQFTLSAQVIKMEPRLDSLTRSKQPVRLAWSTFDQVPTEFWEKRVYVIDKAWLFVGDADTSCLSARAVTPVERHVTQY